MDFVNPCGSFVGYIVSIILRVAGGEATLNIEPFIKYPNYNEEDGQLFPFRTFSMLSGIVCIIGVSFLTNYLFRVGILPKSCDILRRTKHSVKVGDSSVTARRCCDSDIHTISNNNMQLRNGTYST